MSSEQDLGGFPNHDQGALVQMWPRARQMSDHEKQVKKQVDKARKKQKTREATAYQDLLRWQWNAGNGNLLVRSARSTFVVHSHSIEREATFLADKLRDCGTYQGRLCLDLTTLDPELVETCLYYIHHRDPPSVQTKWLTPKFAGWPAENSECICNSMRVHGFAHSWGVQRIKGNAVRWLRQSVKKLDVFVRTLRPQDIAGWAAWSKIHFNTYEAVKCVWSVSDLKDVIPAADLLMELLFLLDEHVFKRGNLPPPAWHAEKHWSTLMAPAWEKHNLKLKKAELKALSAGPAAEGLEGAEMSNTSETLDDMTAPGTPEPVAATSIMPKPIPDLAHATGGVVIVNGSSQATVGLPVQPKD